MAGDPSIYRLVRTDRTSLVRENAAGNRGAARTAVTSDPAAVATPPPNSARGRGRTHRLTITGVILAAGTFAACGPPAETPLLPQCGPYSVVHEEAPLPCIPGPGDRIDVVMAGPVTPATPATIRDAAVARCVDMNGTAAWSDTVQVNQRTLICRTAGGA